MNDTEVLINVLKAIVSVLLLLYGIRYIRIGIKDRKDLFYKIVWVLDLVTGIIAIAMSIAIWFA